MANLLNKAPWSTKSNPETPHPDTHKEQSSGSSFLSKAPWASKDKDQSAQSHKHDGQQPEHGGTFFSKVQAPWANKSKATSHETHQEGEQPTSGTAGGGIFSKAPWTSKESKEAESDRKEQSLTTILSTREDRTNFLMLVADCTETMRKSMLNTFDPNITGEQKDLDGKQVAASRPHTSDGKSDDGSVLDLKHEDPTVAELDDETRAKAAIAEAEADEDDKKKKQAEQENKKKSQEEAQEKNRKDHETRVKEVSSADMKDLKEASLESFDAWRERVLGRVGEAVNNSDEPPSEDKASTKTEKHEGSSEDMSKSIQLPDAAVKHLYPPHDTPFATLDEPRRILLLHSLLLLMLSLETYSSYSRILLLHICSSLKVPVTYLSQDESKVAQGLLEAAKEQMNADEETKKAADQNVWGRRIKVGLGTVAGAALIGITGGLAAPLLAAGIGTVMGGLGLGATATATYLGAMAGSAPLVGALFGAYGGRMAGQMVDNYAKEINDFAFIPIHRPVTSIGKGGQSDRRLRVTIGISGWLNDASDVVKPWQVLGHTGIEAFALRFELEALIKLGNALTTYAKSAAWGVASKTVISQTLFATLAAGLWPLGIVKAARVVDNPFSVARSRSEKAGRVLADALINKVQGERPVVLAGYSLGARVVYYCLDELSRRKAFGLVESVVLAGAAVPADSAVWRRIRSVVAGRVVNVFSTSDYLLGFLYRTASLQYGVAGLQAIEGVAGIENIDVSESVNGHTQYRFLTGKILKKIGFEDIDDDAVAQQEKLLHTEEEKQEQERKEAEAKQGDKDDEGQLEEMEKEVEKKNEKSLFGKMGDRMNAMRLGVGEKISGNGRSKTPEGHLTEEEKFRRAQEQELKDSVNDGKGGAASGFGTAAGGAAASIT